MQEHKLDASYVRLYEARKNPSEKFFQLITGRLYSIASSKLKDTNVLLHCQCLPEGLGDVSQVFLCAEKIKKNRPHYNIKVAIRPEGDLQDKIKNIFPIKKFDTVFVRGSYEEETKRFESLARTSFPLGVAVPMSVAEPVLRSTASVYSSVREYGFGTHPDTHGNTLSMGLRANEEGINIPNIPARFLKDIQTPWLREALKFSSQPLERRIYHQYLHEVPYKTAGLYTVAAIESKKSDPVDVFINFQYPLKDLVAWGMLDLNFLKEKGIGKLVCVKQKNSDSFETETIDIGPGKEIRLLSGSLSKTDMEIIQQHSENFFGCTGDLTVSEGLALNKFLFYDAPGHKGGFFVSLQETAQQMKLARVKDFFERLTKYNEAEKAIYESNTPRKRGFFYPEPNFDLSADHSIPRKSAKELSPVLGKFAEDIAAFYQDPKCVEEMRAFTQHICREFDFESRLIDIVDRGLFLRNYPEVLAIETELQEKFLNGKITEDEVKKQLSSAIRAALDADKENLVDRKGSPTPGKQ